MSDKPYIIAAVLVIIWTLESWLPHFESFITNRRQRRAHGLKHLFIGLLNGLLGTLLVTGITAKFLLWVESERFGLTRALPGPGWMKTIAALILFDLWMYVWHRMNHQIHFLWRWHRMHHSDPELDVTSALRFHPGEALLGSFARLPVAALLGMSLAQLALYEAIFFPIILFHHSNILLPKKWDDWLRLFIVTPGMHWVHHSDYKPETNSNYGSILSLWDRVFNSHVVVKDPDTIHFGLKGYDDAERQSFKGLMLTPIDRDSDSG